jgi:hypothetical protein
MPVSGKIKAPFTAPLLLSQEAPILSQKAFILYFIKEGAPQMNLLWIKSH